MATPGIAFNIPPFWDEEYKHLDYSYRGFNSVDAERWLAHGYPYILTGNMCDMSNKQPEWTQKVIDYFTRLKWKDVSTTFFCMTSGSIIPVHQDRYPVYIDLFKLQEMPSTIYRAIVFLEDWSSGHYFELNGEPIIKWKAGDTVIWNYDTPHMAANVGLKSRYTLQITGHL